MMEGNARKVVALVGANASGSSVYHNLDSREVMVVVYDASGNNMACNCTIRIVSMSEVMVYAPTWMLPGTMLTVVVVG